MLDQRHSAFWKLVDSGVQVECQLFNSWSEIRQGTSVWIPVRRICNSTLRSKVTSTLQLAGCVPIALKHHFSVLPASKLFTLHCKGIMRVQLSCNFFLLLWFLFVRPWCEEYVQIVLILGRGIRKVYSWQLSYANCRSKKKPSICIFIDHIWMGTHWPGIHGVYVNLSIRKDESQQLYSLEIFIFRLFASRNDMRAPD